MWASWYFYSIFLVLVSLALVLIITLSYFFPISGFPGTWFLIIPGIYSTLTLYWYHLLFSLFLLFLILDSLLFLVLIQYCPCIGSIYYFPGSHLIIFLILGSLVIDTVSFLVFIHYWPCIYIYILVSLVLDSLLFLVLIHYCPCIDITYYFPDILHDSCFVFLISYYFLLTYNYPFFLVFLKSLYYFLIIFFFCSMKWFVITLWPSLSCLDSILSQVLIHYCPCIGIPYYVPGSHLN